MAEGEVGVELDTGLLKVGDGINVWSALPYDVGNAGTLSAGSQTAAGLVVFSNSNNVSFGLSNNTLTASVNAANGVQFSAGTLSQTRTDITFGDSNGVSFGLDTNGVVTATVAAANNFNISAGTTSSDVTAVTFRNSNGLAFGYDGTNVTGSYTVPTVTNSSWTVSDAVTSATVGRLAFTNSNGLTLSLSTSNNGNHTVIGSYTVPTVTNSSWTVSDSATSATVGRIAFSNSNGVTFGLSTSNNGNHTLTASVGAASSWTVSDSVTSATVGRLAFTASNGLTLTLSTSNNGNHTVIGSYTVPTVTNSTLTVSDAATSIGAAQIAFTNSNGLTLSLSTTTGGSATVVGSYTVPTVTNSSWTVSDANTSATVGRLAFTNSNGLTLSLSTSNNGNHTVIGSYTVPTVTSWTVSDAATSATVGRLAFTNSNGLTLSLSTSNNGNHTVIGSYTVPTVTNSSWTVSDSATSATVGRLAFTASNGLTLTLSTSNNGNHTVIGSYTVPTVTNSSLTLSDSATSMTIGRLAFTASNGLTLTLSTAAGGSATLVGSYTVPTQSNQTVGLYASSNTYLTSSGTQDARSLSFRGDKSITVGISSGEVLFSVGAYLTTAAQSSQTLAFSLGGNSGTTNSSQILNGGYVIAGGANITINQSNNSVSIVGAGGGSPNFSAGTTSNNLGSVVFADSNGVSWGLDGSTITATVKTNYLTTAALSSQTLAFTVSGNSSTVNSSQISNGGYALAGGNKITVYQSNNTVSISADNYITTAALSSQTLAFSLGGNSATTNSSQVLNGGYVLAGGNSLTIQQSNNTLSFSVGAYITTGALSSQTLAFSLGGNSGTTNSSQILNGGYVLAGGNNVTINQSNNSVSISAGAINIANSQATYSNSTVNLLEGGGAITIASSAGGQSFKFSVPQTSSIVGANGISISTNGSTISVMSQYASMWANLPKFIDDNSTTCSASGSVLQVVPFFLPYAMSLSYIRIPVSMSQVSSESAGTTANTTYTWNRSYTDAAVIYSQNVGASSLSLVYLTSSFASWVFQKSYTAGAQGSRYTITDNVTWPITGGYSNAAVGNSAQSSANVGFSTGQLTAFTGLRWVDIPMAISLSAGNYWVAFGRSTNSASNAGNSGLTGASMGLSYVGVSHSNVAIGRPGEATNSSIQLIPGLGSWSTNAAVMSTSSLQLASISMQSSHPLIYFQMIRQT